MLSHHGHSGRVLPHHHTSFAGLTFLFLVTAIVLTGYGSNGRAESNSLSLRVDGPPPSQAPIITNPVTDQHFTAVPITVSGTCLAGLMIKLYRNNLFTGSTICLPDGSFSLQSDLFEGKNDLVARMYDALDQPGPDSAIVTVYYDITTPTPTPNPTPQPGQTTPQPTQKPSPGRTVPLLIKTNTAYFIGVSPGSELIWPVEISGGQGPYAASWDWGDGTVELYSLSGAGELKATHVYSSAGNYHIMVRVSDNAGRQAFLQLVAIVNGELAPATTTRYFDGRLLIAWPLWFLALVMMISFWLGEKYKQAHQSPKSTADPA